MHSEMSKDKIRQSFEKIRTLITDFCRMKQEFEAAGLHNIGTAIDDILEKNTEWLASLIIQVTLNQGPHEVLNRKFALYNAIINLLNAETRFKCNEYKILCLIFERFETSYTPRTPSGVFTQNILGLALFGNKQMFTNGSIDQTRQDLIKHLIEDGNDVIYAAHTFLATQTERNDQQLRRLRNEFNKSVSLFFKAINADAVQQQIKAAASEHGLYIKSIQCGIGHHVPVLPVIYNGQIYDLFDLALTMSTKEGRRTPYEFILNGKKLDSHDIQFHSSYDQQVISTLSNRSSLLRLYDQTRTILHYNHHFFRQTIMFMVGSIGIIQALYYMDLIQSDNQNISGAPNRANFLANICKAAGAFMRCTIPNNFDAQIDLHPNAYIRNLNHCNFAFVISVLAFNFTLLNFSNHHSDSHIFPVMPFNSKTANVALNLFMAYPACLIAYIAAAFLNAPDLQPADSLSLEAKVKVHSPVFEKNKITPLTQERATQEQSLTLCFNHLVATKEAPVALVGRFNGGCNPIVDKILAFNFDEKFKRYKYT